MIFILRKSKISNNLYINIKKINISLVFFLQNHEMNARPIQSTNGRIVNIYTPQLNDKHT